MTGYDETLAPGHLAKRKAEFAKAFKSDPTTAETPTMRERLDNAAFVKVACIGTVPTRTLEMLIPLIRDAILREMLEPSEGMLNSVADLEKLALSMDAEGAVNFWTAWRRTLEHILNETKD